jgi:hypothetical protein
MAPTTSSSPTSDMALWTCSFHARRIRPYHQDYGLPRRAPRLGAGELRDGDHRIVTGMGAGRQRGRRRGADALERFRVAGAAAGLERIGEARHCSGPLASDSRANLSTRETLALLCEREIARKDHRTATTQRSFVPAMLKYCRWGTHHTGSEKACLVLLTTQLAASARHFAGIVDCIALGRSVCSEIPVSLRSWGALNPAPCPCPSAP